MYACLAECVDVYRCCSKSAKTLWLFWTTIVYYIIWMESKISAVKNILPERSRSPNVSKIWHSKVFNMQTYIFTLSLNTAKNNTISSNKNNNFLFYSITKCHLFLCWQIWILSSQSSMSHDPLIICIFGAQDMTYFLSVLKTVVLLNIFVETIFCRILWWIETRKFKRTECF